MPGILGACISAVIASVATEDVYGDSYKNVIRRDDGSSQAAFQIYSLLVSLALAVGGDLSLDSACPGPPSTGWRKLSCTRTKSSGSAKVRKKLMTKKTNCRPWLKWTNKNPLL